MREFGLAPQVHTATVPTMRAWIDAQLRKRFALVRWELTGRTPGCGDLHFDRRGVLPEQWRSPRGPRLVADADAIIHVAGVISATDAAAFEQGKTEER